MPKEIQHSIASLQQPYQNKSLKSIKGERWKPILGFGDQYMVSSFGRVKSLERDIFIAGWNYSQVYPERIKSLHLHSWHNKHVNDDTINLNVTLYFEGKSRSIAVRRLVYHCFVEEIDFDDHTFNILCKDGNGLNVHYKNLEKATLTERQERIFKKERLISFFRYMDREKSVKTARLANEKQVSVYSLEGIKIASYESIRKAAKATGIGPTMINSVLKGEMLKTGQYAWRYGDGPGQIDLEGFFKERSALRSRMLQKAVTQYTLEGERIAMFEGYKIAGIATGVSPSLISLCARQFPRAGRGYIWKEGKGRKKIKVN